MPGAKICLSKHTKSQNGRGWKGPLWVSEQILVQLCGWFQTTASTQCLFRRTGHVQHVPAPASSKELLRKFLSYFVLCLLLTVLSSGLLFLPWFYFCSLHHSEFHNIITLYSCNRILISVNIAQWFYNSF